MKQLALLIGSSYGDPPGIVNDIAAMRRLLPSGFTIRELVGPAATRDTIMQQLATLQAEVESDDDVVVVYYCGHGAHVFDADVAVGSSEPRRIQCICPTDYDQSTDDDLRAVTAWDLSLASAGLTTRTKNVTWIFDCCYSARMSRDGGSPPRARAKPTWASFVRYLDRLRTKHPGLTALPALGNPDAVRVVACGEDDSAFPAPAPPRFRYDKRDEGIGALTLALAEVFETLGNEPWSWHSIAIALRERVALHGNAQRPDVEGPSLRRPFSLATVDGTVVGIRPIDNRFELAAGSILGVSIGDRWAVMAGAQPIVVVEIDEVTPVTARGRLVEQTGELPTPAVAVPRQRAFRRVAIAVPASSTHPDRITNELAATAQLRVAGDGDAPRVELSLDSAGLATIRDLRGALFTGLSLDAAICRLAERAIVERLHEARDDQGIAPGEVDVTWGTVEDGKLRPRPATGDILGLGDRIAVRVANRSPGPIYAHVFNVGTRGTITSLEDPRGRRVSAGSEEIIGDNVANQLVGFELSWPVDLPEQPPRVDSLLTIVTRTPVDLSALGSTTASATARGNADCLFQWRDYWLFPLAATLGLPNFVRDDHPTLCDGPGVVRRVSARVGLRSSVPCRVDVFIITSDAYAARTLRVGDDPKTLVLELDARRFLEICVWRSVDGSGPDLATGLADRELPAADSPGAARQLITTAARLLGGRGVYHTAAASTDSYGAGSRVAMTCDQLVLDLAIDETPPTGGST